MAKKSDRSGTVYLRGQIWWVKVYVGGQSIRQSSKSTNKKNAINLRDKLLGNRARGELSGGIPDRVLINELLDDVLKSDIEESTRKIWRLVVEKSIRPFFGKLKATRLTTDKMDQYRKKRKDGGVTDATVNRELSILRTAFHNGRKRTPAKVNIVPYFPMVKETTVRQGFLSDEKYERLRDELPHELKALFVCDYNTGIRKSELLAIQWPQVDFKAGLITLSKGETKGKDARTCPILDGDMHDLLWAAYQERQKNWPKSPWVFNRSGKQIKSFRGAWKSACQRAGVSDLHLHDMRRTAVRNMRDAGVPQSIRMQISGHKTDSMERRYSIVDREDIVIAKALMEKRVRRSEIVPEIVPTLG
jgi:integrase